MDWVVLVFISALFLLATARFLFYKRFQEFAQLPLTDKYFKLQGKDYEIPHPFNLLLFGMQWMAYSLFFYFLLKWQQSNTEVLAELNFIQIWVGVGVFVIGKYYLSRMLATIFKADALIKAYLYEKMTYHNWGAIVVLIANAVFLYVFTPNLAVLYGFIAIIVAFYGISFISSVKRNRNAVLGSLFYFILYLCALEIAPYLVLYKTIIAS